MPEKHTAVLKLFGRIEKNETFTSLAGRLEYLLDCDDPKNIRVLIAINSYGGSANEALALYEYLKQFPLPVDAFGFGSVSSAALHVYLACRRRFCAPKTSFTIHQAVYRNNGVTTYRGWKKIMEQMAAKEQLCRKITADATGVPIAKADEWFTQGITMGPKTAQAFGIVHEIVDMSYLEQYAAATDTEQ